MLAAGREDRVRVLVASHTNYTPVRAEDFVIGRSTPFTVKNRDSSGVIRASVNCHSFVAVAND